MVKTIEERWIAARNAEIEYSWRMVSYARALAKKYNLSPIAVGSRPIDAYYFIRSLRGEGKK